MVEAPERVIELVETFDRNIEAYRSQQYNETQLRRECLDPLFEELGWDVTIDKAGRLVNRQRINYNHLAEASRRQDNGEIVS
jgi:hypothetical protein